MKPFRCHVTILNTKDNLGKFERKADEGYFVGYLMVIVAGNQTNSITGSKENLVAGQDDIKKALEQEYILIPICTTDPFLTQGSKDSTVDARKKAPRVGESEASNNGGKNDQVPRSEVESLLQQERQTTKINSTNSFNTVSSPINIVRSSFVNAASQTLINVAGPSASTNAFEEHSFERFSPFKNAFSLPHVPIVTPIDDTGIFGNAYDDEVLEEEVDMNNLDSSYIILEATNLDGDDDDVDYDKESIISMNTDIFETPSSIVIATSPPILPFEDLEDSLIMGNEELNTIPIPSESEDTSGSESSLLFSMLIEDECFDPGGDVDKINDFEDGYYDSKGDILYLESFLNDDLVYCDPSIPTMSVAFILDEFTDELPLEHNDDLFDLEPKNDE
nr:ribonuclease H-like domain-containing protein [Tanacetum cinerariifolium]